MRIYINNQIAKHMLLGSSIYSTGGGIEYGTQEKHITSLLKKYRSRSLELISIEELKDEDYICTVYQVGSSANTNFDASSFLRLGINTLEDYTGKKFKAIFAGETNIDSVVFQAAGSLGLPVVDADSNGGRAVPQIQFDNFVLKKKSITPLVAVTPTKEIRISRTKNVLSIENTIRSIASKLDDGLITVCDHPINVKEAKEILTLGIFSRSIELGKLIFDNKDPSYLLNQVIKKIDGKLFIRGKIVKIELKDKQGFLEGYYWVRDNKNELRVYVKNENIICWLNDKVILTVPDCILAVDIGNLRGLHNSKLREGQGVVVIGKRATDLWRTKEAIELFNPKHFGFDIKSKLL